MVPASATGIPTACRRREGNTTLGLFNKIAAARKENLSTLGKAFAEDLTPLSRNSEGKFTLRTRQSPKLSDALRTSANNLQNFDSRWYPQSMWTTQHSSRAPLRPQAAPANGTILSAQEAQSKRSIPVEMVASASRTWRVLPLHHYRFDTPDSPTELQHNNSEVPNNKPRVQSATASKIRPSGYYENVRGYVRRSPEVLSTLLDSSHPAQNWHRLREVTDSPHIGRANLHTDDRCTKTLTGLSFKKKERLGGAKDLVKGPNQEVQFALTAEIPGVPVVYRNQKAKSTNPERISLDRRNLPVIPLIEGEQTLRVLNLQNNTIRRIENLLGLPNLIFLDLYNNRIEKLENLHSVPNLRFLTIGRNCLRIIENLECLKKLEVLDLHSNEIEQIQNLNDLRELRVLNLAKNLISTVESIDKLMQLTELNLRQNRISSLKTIGKLPSLTKLYLSNNKLETLKSIEPLFQILSINELRLDSNGCTSNRTEYRERMINGLPLLKHLDSKPVTDADGEEPSLRAAASNKGIENAEAFARTHAISCIKADWEKRKELVSSSKDSRGGQVLLSWEISVAEKVISSVEYDERETILTSREEIIVYNNNAGFSEVEVYDNYRILVIYGNALRALELTKAHSEVNAVSFRFVKIDTIKAAVTSATNANFKLFSRLTRLIFAFNDLNSFDELLWLSAVGSKAEEVYISQNPVCAKTKLKEFIGARITNILRINGEEITPIDQHTGKQHFPHSNSTRVQSAEAPDGSSSVNLRTRERNVKNKKPSGVSPDPHSIATHSNNTDSIQAALDIKMKTAVRRVLVLMPSAQSIKKKIICHSRP